MRKNESGRSMVEMLGVLAIIGVLSIGGIAGYTLSMNRYRANAIADAANKLASMAYADCMGQITVDPSITTSTCTANGKTAEAYGLGTPENTTLTVSAIADDGASVTAAFDGTPEKIQDAYASILGIASATAAKKFKSP